MPAMEDFAAPHCGSPCGSSNGPVKTYQWSCLRGDELKQSLARRRVELIDCMNEEYKRYAESVAKGRGDKEDAAGEESDSRCMMAMQPLLDEWQALLEERNFIIREEIEKVTILLHCSSVS